MRLSGILLILSLIKRGSRSCLLGCAGESLAAGCELDCDKHSKFPGCTLARAQKSIFMRRLRGRPDYFALCVLRQVYEVSVARAQQ